MKKYIMNYFATLILLGLDLVLSKPQTPQYTLCSAICYSRSDDGGDVCLKNGMTTSKCFASCMKLV